MTPNKNPMTSNPIDEAIEALRVLMRGFDGLKNSDRAANKAAYEVCEMMENKILFALRALKSTHVIIPKKDVPEGLGEATDHWILEADDENCSEGEEWYPVDERKMKIVFKAAALIAEQLEG